MALEQTFGKQRGSIRAAIEAQAAKKLAEQQAARREAEQLQALTNDLSLVQAGDGAASDARREAIARAAAAVRQAAEDGVQPVVVIPRKYYICSSKRFNKPRSRRSRFVTKENAFER